MFDDALGGRDDFPQPVSHDEHGARSVACPFCHAKVGEACHSTAVGPDVHVHRDHQARLDAFHRTQGPQN